MKQNLYFGSRFLASALLFSGTFVLAQAPDNTKVNKTETPTADKQKNDPGDRELTQKVRKALMEDKTLSTYAHNVKVIARNGSVTLKGPVRTEEEKTAIEAKAKEVAGPDKVTSEITVAPKKKAVS